jgi:DNA (cytosine-5)-methyltransferase 1
MKHGSLFSGIGGFDLAADWMGWENIFHCEIAEFPRKILNHYWPNADCHEDIKKTDFTKYRGTVDIISGGFPCQPYSAAGKRLGKEDDRHLWPEMLRVIREVKPQWVVGENVRGLLNWNGGMVFHEVCADLENIGYEVQAFIIPASGINAPHQRERLWVVAHSTNYNRRSAQSRWDEKKEYFFSESKRFSKEWFTAHTDNTRTNNGMQSNGEWKENDKQRRGQSQSEHWENGINGITPDTESKRTREQSSENRGREDGRFNDISKDGNVADTSNERLQRSKVIGGISPGRQERNKFLTRRFCSNWENFPTQSPICGGDDGISYGLDNITFSKWRNESIKGYGNAVVPQVVYRIFKTIEHIQNLKQND